MTDASSSASETESDSSSEEENGFHDQKGDTRHRLSTWYGQLPARRVDLVGDYAGKELFMIEGDSLLLRCLDDPKIDFAYGFQLLHAVWAVEHFLNGLVQRKCNFHIAFFQVHQDLCIPPDSPTAVHPKYLLARAAIIRHLQAHLPKSYPGIKVHTFTHIQSSKFAEYLIDSGIYFVMCHDGALPLLARPQQDGRVRRANFRAMIHWLVARGYNVALINGLEWMDTKVMTMVIENSQTQRLPPPFQRSMTIDSATETPKCSYIAYTLNALLVEDSKKDLSQTKGHKCAQISEPKTLGERLLLTVVTLAKLLQEEHTPVIKFMAYVLLLHALLLSDVRLSRRRQTFSADNGAAHEEYSSFVGNFSSTAREIMQDSEWQSFARSMQTSCDIADLVDGRLLNTLLHSQKQGLSSLISDSQLTNRMAVVVQAVCALSGVHLDLSDSSPPAARFTTRHNGLKAGHGDQDVNISIMPFSNSVFDKHLASVHITVDHSKVTDKRSIKIFKELTHWHNAKRHIDPKVDYKMSSERAKFLALRRNQFFMAEMTAYAASLTNSTGKSLEPEIMTVSDRKANKTIPFKKTEDKASKKPSANSAPKSKVGAGKKAMLENIAAERAAKDESNADKILMSWQTVRKSLDEERDEASKYLKAKSYLTELSGPKSKVLEAEVESYMLNILLTRYIRMSGAKKEAGSSQENERMGIAAMIWDSLRRVSVTAGLTKTIATNIEQIAKALALPAANCTLLEVDRKMTFDFYLPSSIAKTISIPMSAREFQLAHCGPYMDRNLDSAPDHRVPFEPDGWQRKVLDELDADRSVFVVAPTSAGKTFISFYAMERILKGDDDGVLVYVAPTKALVNQIAAEIQARFKKNYKYAGKSVWAIHTRDYRINNPSGCQILVTVPHILQIMLLAPSNAKTWAPRVRRIIFDEIHSIGQAEDGVVWEQLLLLAPCPIVALSATVGNPEEFESWLKSTQESAGFELTMVKHPHRYSDLRKFVYTPPKHYAFTELKERPSFARLGLDGIPGLAFLHPVASLVNKTRGMPDDLSLEARDCLTLWQAMVKNANDDYPINASLNPSKGAVPLTIRKADIIDWERSLKEVLKSWMLDDKSPFDKVMRELSGRMQQDGKDEDMKEAKEAQAKSKIVDSNNLRETTLPLLVRLHERDALPAIFFNYDRSKCEEICQAVLKQLKAAEQGFKKNSPTWKTRLDGWEQWKRTQAKLAAKKIPKAAAAKKGKAHDDDSESKADKVMDSASEEISPYASFDPDAPVDGFHFAAKRKLVTSELNGYFWQLKRRGISPTLMEALARGIGVHHAGMNRKYRQVVEMLFRKGYLRVVIATGTLALGINMPCATVVFSGDSVFLTALNYRQAAGRAGRRGFDLLGNVVFQGVSYDKVCRLLSSRLPDLNGHFPVTTTLVLRLFTLLHESGSPPYAIQAIDSLLSQPRLYLDGPSFRDQVLHHLRFSIEYLRRQRLLSAGGAPINFAGLVSHLYFTENSSFALNVLLEGGYFHELCADIKTKESSILDTLMIVMAHLFGRRPCRQVDQEFVENIVHRSSSIMFLPPLPSRAARILREHNNSTLQIFTTYVKTFVDQHVQTEDNTLPLTGFKAGGQETFEGLFESLPPTRVRSSFAALSGHGDTFDSISDLCSTSRGGVFLEEEVIPHLDVYPDEAKSPLNAYLYDFYKNGDLNSLVKANGIRRGDVWFTLNDFSLVLATITTSLANFLKLPNSELDMIDLVGGGDTIDMMQDDKFAEDASTDDGRSSQATLVNEIRIPTRPKTKTMVANSWDDAGDEASEEEMNDNQSETTYAEDEYDNDGNLLNVYQALQKLKRGFDTKFKAIFA